MRLRLARSTLAMLAVLGFATTADAQDTPSGRFLGPVVAQSPVYQTTLRNLIRLEPKLPVWVRNIIPVPRYVALASRVVTIEGQSLELFDVCKPKECLRSYLRVMFTPDGKTGWGLVWDAELGEIPLGKPTPPMIEVLRQTAVN